MERLLEPVAQTAQRELAVLALAARILRHGHDPRPSREMISCFCSSDRAAEAATSKTASIRDAVTLACWPPGPDEREARTVISASGIARDLRWASGLGSR